MPKFKSPLQKEILQVGEVLFILTGDTYCHVQRLISSLYSILSMHHEKLGCLLIVNGDRSLVRDIEDRLVPDHIEGALWIINYLDLHEIILRDQQYALEVIPKDTSVFQD